MGTILKVKNLKTYFYTLEGIVKAVDGVSYDVEEGETIALVGESGCGKSVSAFSIMRLIPTPPGKIVAGEVIFNEKDLLNMDNEGIRKIRGKEIAMVFQEPLTCLNPVTTIGCQLTETLEIHLNMSGSRAKKRAQEVLTLVGIPDPEQRLLQYPHHLSGGMRQRVMIAMALSCNPKLILADEPTTALDVTIQAQILELLKELTKSLGLAMIIITHNLGVVARYANRVNVMYAGRIVESGIAKEIYYNPLHPYTIGLLHSVPRLDQPRKAKLEPIQGQPPDLAHLPQGCRFIPRCTLAEEKCSSYDPVLTDFGQNHLCACWKANKLDFAGKLDGRGNGWNTYPLQ